MTIGRDQEAILADRLKTVLALTEANAEEARARAGLGGAEIGRLSTEDGSAEDVAEAARHESAAEARLTAARGRIAELETKLADLDREIEARER